MSAMSDLIERGAVPEVPGGVCRAHGGSLRCATAHHGTRTRRLPAGTDPSVAPAADRIALTTRPRHASGPCTVTTPDPAAGAAAPLPGGGHQPRPDRNAELLAYGPDGLNVLSRGRGDGSQDRLLVHR